MSARSTVEDIRLVLETAGMAPLGAVPEDMSSLNAEAGAYLLVIELSKAVGTRVNRRSTGQLPPGAYIYAGSAKGPGGLAARLRRHFRRDKKHHWHVDALTVEADALSALAIAGADECELAAHLLRTGRFGIVIDGFGSTDCTRCRSHLLKPL
ncbi:MAG: GIY-YIG nuclease family protein [Henriciella sp.]|uniref:GIY-YIG nuclease family protein n=1 Tax=Henriciella sp. TaxID=1968823 RepID=UPI0032EAE9AD